MLSVVALVVVLTVVIAEFIEVLVMVRLVSIVSHPVILIDDVGLPVDIGKLIGA